MITHIHIRNFRSFVDAEVTLQPFSLVVGANGSGKTNLLRFLEFVFGAGADASTTRHVIASNWVRHLNKREDQASFELRDVQDRTFKGASGSDGHWLNLSSDFLFLEKAQLFNLNATDISNVESIQPRAKVGPSGQGTTQVLDALKNGDREDLFDAIETQFRKYVPEVEKVSLLTVNQGHKIIQVRERSIEKPLPASMLSEGTRIILAILTIIHQEQPPKIIMLEDIDRGLHPRLFEYLTPLMRDIAIRHDINIIATTHNPYLVDAFQDDKEAVIIVEKKDGASTLSTLAQRLEGLDYDSVDPDDMPLGQLWFSGLVGGTPKAISTRVS